MNPRVLSALNFLRLVDENGSLSISNIAVMVIIVKLGLQPCFDLASAATLLTVIGNYAFKSWHRPRRVDTVEAAVKELTTTVKNMHVSVEKLKMRAGFVD